VYWQWPGSANSPLVAGQVHNEVACQARQSTHLHPDQVRGRTTTKPQPSWGNDQSQGHQLKDNSWVKGEPWQDFSQLFSQQSDSRLHGCTISKLTLSTDSWKNCWGTRYLGPWHLLSYKYLPLLTGDAANTSDSNSSP